MSTTLLGWDLLYSKSGQLVDLLVATWQENEQEGEESFPIQMQLRMKLRASFTYLFLERELSKAKLR
jgi:hypothetical protein